MRLLDAAKYFDRLVVADAYTPATTFKGQLSLFDDSMRDGTTVVRRVLSVDPAVTMPSRGVVCFSGRNWLVGQAAPDSYDGVDIRHRYVLHHAQTSAVVKTPGEALAASAGLTAYASRLWIKDLKEVEVSSDFLSLFGIYFSPSETINEGSLIQLDGRWHMIRSSLKTAAGFRVAVSEELPEPVLESAMFGGRVYNPVTDAYSNTPLSVQALRLRYQAHFRYKSEAAQKFDKGDMQVLVLKSVVTPKAGDQVTLSDGAWNVESVVDEAPVWSLHVCHV